MDWDDFAKVLVHQVTVPYLERFVGGDRGAGRTSSVVTVAELGNMASATHRACSWTGSSGELAPGDRVLFVGLGGGVSMMTMVWEKS